MRPHIRSIRILRLATAVATVGAVLGFPLATAASAASPTIAVGTNPYAVAVNPSTNTVYVANAGGDSISVINGLTSAVATTISTGHWSYPEAVAVNSLTNTVYVANYSTSTVSVIDGSTNTITSTVSVGGGPRGIAVNPSTNTVYVANAFGNSVSVIDGSTNTVVSTIPVGSYPFGVAVNTSSNIVYVTNYFDGNVSVINGSTRTVTSTVSVGSRPWGVAVNPSTNTVYVANYFSQTVSVINGSSDNVASTVRVGNSPDAVAVNPSTNTVYVANYSDASVSVINGLTNAVISTVSVGGGPQSVTVNPSTGTAYVANYSDATASVIAPSTVPSTPSNVSATVGSSSASVSWTDGASNGSSITSRTIYIYDGSTLVTTKTNCAGSPCTVTGLTNGTSYTFKVSDTNGVGEGALSSASSPVTPATNPGAPTITSATGGNAQATIAWTDGASNGSAITSESIYVYSGSTLVTTKSNCSGSPCTVTGLTNGTSYSFKVSDTNGVGEGALSWPVKPVAIGGVSCIPVSGTGNDYAGCDFSGRDLSGMYFRWDDFTGASFAGANLSGANFDNAWIDGVNFSRAILTSTQFGGASLISANFLDASMQSTYLDGAILKLADLRYADLGGAQLAQGANLAGANLAGSNLMGVAWDASTTCTDGANGPCAAVAPVVPEAPQGIVVTSGSGSGSARLFWQPSRSFGSAIQSYTVTASPGGATCSYTVTNPETDTCTVQGLTPGSTYTFSVTATNGIGTSGPSTGSNVLVPALRPSAPTITSVTRGNSEATVAWSDGASNGSSITSQTIYIYSGSTLVTADTGCSGSPCTVTGLTNGTSYTFKVSDTNGGGEGALSSTSSAVTPATTPGAPQSVTVTTSGGQAVVSWSPPASSGGSPVSSYAVATTTGSHTCSYTVATPETDTCTVTGLANGSSYTFVVTATNGVGAGTASDVVAATVLYPGPVLKSAVAATHQVTLTWTAPTVTNGKIVSFTGSVTDGNGHTFYCSASKTATKCTITGLTDLTTYTASVFAVENSGGTTSASSNTITVTPAQPLTLPFLHAVALTSNHSVTFVWGPAGGGDGQTPSYVVTVLNPNGSTFYSTTTAGNAAAATGLTKGVKYSYTVAVSTSASLSGLIPGVTTKPVSFTAK